MKALYRKYRPTTLSEVVGQEQVTKSLEASLGKGRISHAYLFIGPRGCGKTSVARIFAHEINHFKYEIEDFYPDILEIDAASNTGVDNIRELRERATIAPTEGKYKVYIIDEVHMLSKSAFNALLKTLEEPPAHVVFIMATTDAYKIPSTITSRSEIYEFQLASPDVMKKHLGEIAKKEGIKIEDGALDIIVQRGGGSFRDSISLLDQISTLSSDKISAELISKTLGLPEQSKIENLIEAYRSGSLSEISARLKDLLNSGTRPEIIAEDIINRIVENPTADLLPLLKPLSSVSNPFPEAKLLLAFTSGQELKHSEIPVKTPPDVVVSKSEIISRSENPSALDWPTFCATVRTSSPSLADVLNKTTHKIEKDTLIIIPEKKIYRTILTAENNAKVLRKSLPENFNLQVLDPEDAVISTNNAKISKISAIMGNVKEVNAENGGENPF